MSPHVISGPSHRCFLKNLFNPPKTNCRKGLMQVKVAIFWEADRAIFGAWIGQFLEFRRNHPGGSSLAMAHPSFDGWELPGCPPHLLRDVP
jgi:hypothetical protein